MSIKLMNNVVYNGAVSNFSVILPDLFLQCKYLFWEYAAAFQMG